MPGYVSKCLWNNRYNSIYIYIGTHRQLILYESANLSCTNYGRLGHTSSKCTHNPVNLSDHADSPKGKDSTEGWKQVQFPARLTQKLPTRTRAGNHLHESQLPKGKFLTMDTANEHKTTKQERSGKSSDLKKSIESETATSNYYRRTQVGSWTQIIQANQEWTHPITLVSPSLLASR